MAERIVQVFFHRGYPWLVLYCVRWEFGYFQKLGYFHLELCPELWTLKILQPHVDCRKCCQRRWTLVVTLKASTFVFNMMGVR